jgi:hypothetical protein
LDAESILPARGAKVSKEWNFECGSLFLLFSFSALVTRAGVAGVAGFELFVGRHRVLEIR